MTTRRMAKASEAIRESVATTILFELKDPRVQNVTILRAEAAPDMRTAKVYLSVMGDAKKQSLCLHGLESARGFIQAKLADRLQTRYTPVLKFVIDPGIHLAAETARLLQDVIDREEPPELEAAGSDDAGSDDEDEQLALLTDDDVSGDDAVADESSTSTEHQ